MACMAGAFVWAFTYSTQNNTDSIDVILSIIQLISKEPA
jgi:hypothetical protein